MRMSGPRLLDSINGRPRMIDIDIDDHPFETGAEASAVICV